MIKNKNAEVSWVIVSLIIAIIVLIIMIEIFAGPIEKVIKPIIANLPDFGLVKNTPTLDLALFKYSTANSGVQYYDGIKWNDFAGKDYDFNKKRVSNKNLEQDFEDFYFAKRDFPIVEIDGRSFIIEGPFIGEKIFGKYTFNNYILIGGGRYVLDGSGDLYKQAVSVEKNQEIGKIELNNLGTTLIVNVPIGAGSVYEKSASDIKLYLKMINGKVMPNLAEDNTADFGNGLKVVCNKNDLHYSNCYLDFNGVRISNLIFDLTAKPGWIYSGIIKTDIETSKEEYSKVSDAGIIEKINGVVNPAINNVLSKSANFRYWIVKDKNSLELKSNIFKVEKKGNDLVVDLNLPLGSERKAELRDW